jgi:nickel-dependent lactate racemase
MTIMVKVPQLAWHGVKDFELTFPDNWKVTVNNMQGYDRPGLGEAQIRTAVRYPIGSPAIRTLAKDKKQVAIIFDDIQRATRTAEIIPFVLEELAAAGIQDEQIRFIGATGLHSGMNRQDFVKKVGENVLKRFPVFNHNAFGGCTEIGTTSLGTKLLVNAEAMACDFKIGIGSVVPHSFAGFGGGAKIILPGICHHDTILDFHRLGARFKAENPDKKIGTGVVEDSVLRLNMAEAAEMAGLDIKIDVLMNGQGESCAIYTGKLKEAYPRALGDAAEHYDTPVSQDNDVVIANSFHKVAECESGLEIAFPALKESGGEVVLIGHSPDGHVAHYLGGPWGKTNRSPLPMKVKFPEKVRRVIFINAYPDFSILGYFAEPQKVELVSNWEEALALLQKTCSGECRAAVYPNADVQYCSGQSGNSVMSFESK